VGVRGFNLSERGKTFRRQVVRTQKRKLIFPRGRPGYTKPRIAHRTRPHKLGAIFFLRWPQSEHIFYVVACGISRLVYNPKRKRPEPKLRAPEERSTHTSP